MSFVGLWAFGLMFAGRYELVDGILGISMSIPRALR